MFLRRYEVFSLNNDIKTYVGVKFMISSMNINTFKYHVSCIDGKISVRIKLVLLFHRRTIQYSYLCFSTIEWDDGETGNSNLILDFMKGNFSILIIIKVVLLINITLF